MIAPSLFGVLKMFLCTGLTGCKKVQKIKEKALQSIVIVAILLRKIDQNSYPILF